MTKYIIYFDYNKNASEGMTYEYRAMNAKNLEEAIEEADRMILENTEHIYLTRIMAKEGKQVKEDGGWKAQMYRAILCRRKMGWHRNTAQNCENEHIACRHTYKNLEYTEAVC